MDITVYVSPGFNLTSTFSFLDPFITLSRLDAAAQYDVKFVSDTGGPVASLQGPTVDTGDVDTHRSDNDIVLISTSQSPEAAMGAPLGKHLRYWERQEGLIIGLETGAFALADAKVIEGPAAVHPAYVKAFQGLFASVDVSDALFDTDGRVRTCAGGAAALDLALSLLSAEHGADVIRSVSDHLVAPDPRDGAQKLTAGSAAPLRENLPAPLVAAIAAMRGSLDAALSVPELAARTKLSQRQIERLFKNHTGRSPNQYYRMLRLDRAREMVTRGAMPMPDIAKACGFNSAVHFTRAYKQQFGRPPMRDRVRSRRG
ncbi:MAG: helix-turn-helix domain-containing protein [Pseudomonadota bacterium]